MMEIKIGGKYRTRDGRKVNRVLAIDCIGPLPVIVEFEDGGIGGYNLNGSHLKNANTGLDLVEFSPYEDFKIDDPVMVRGELDSTWKRRYFAGLTSEGEPTTFTNGADSWSCQPVDSLDTRVIVWYECRKPTEDELK